MKYGKILVFMLAASLALGACGKKAEAPAETPKVEEPAETPVVEETPAEKPVETTPEATEVATATESEGVELKAAILEKKLTLPGQPFKVHYTVTNTGDKAIAYVQGSGTAVIPDALAITSTGIQVVPPVEELGPMTMDYQTKILEPGASIEFVQPFLAIVPTDDFVQKAMDYKTKTEKYVGDENIETLSESIEGLTAVEPGNYDIKAVFSYTPVDNPEDLSTMVEATNSVEADITAVIS